MIWTGLGESQCDIDALLARFKRDLAAGIAEADDQHALAGIRLGFR